VPADDGEAAFAPPTAETDPVAPVTALRPAGEGPVDADGPEPADDPVADDGDAARAASARWRSGDDWSRADASFADLMADDDTPIGALDERDRLLDEQYLTFEDLDVPQADLPTVPPRGSATDPIRIQRAGGAAAAAARAEVAPARTGDEAPAGELPNRRHPTASDAGDAADVGERESESDSGEGDGRTDVAASATESDEPAVPPAGRDRGQATVVGLSIGAVALAIFVAGARTPWRWLPLVLVVAAIVGALIELYNAAMRAGYRPVNLVGVVAGIALPVAAYLAGSPTIPTGEAGMVLVVFLSLVASMAWYLFGAGRGRPVPNVAVTMLGILYVGVLGSYAALILRAGPWPGTPPGVDQGIPLVILVIVGTEIYNAGGYLFGSRLGRTPLSAASPSKTREGLVLGMASAVGAIVVMGGVLEIGVRTMAEALVLAGVVAVVAPLGDLFESMLKRDLGVKDMGTLIPSHGGLLDRVDALLFTLPASYYALRMLGLI
jgi:phosphatidate cytidylyltransferase